MTPRFLPRRKSLPEVGGLAVQVPLHPFGHPPPLQEGRQAWAGAPLRQNREAGGGSRSCLATETLPILWLRRHSARRSAGTLWPTRPFRRRSFRAIASDASQLRRAIAPSSRHSHMVRVLPFSACLPNRRWRASIICHTRMSLRKGACEHCLCAISRLHSLLVQVPPPRTERRHIAVSQVGRRRRT